MSEKVPKSPYLAVRIVKPSFGRSPIDKDALPSMEEWYKIYLKALAECKTKKGYERRRCLEARMFNEWAKIKGINITYEQILSECENDPKVKEAKTETEKRVRKARCVKSKVEQLFGKIPPNLLTGRVREVFFELVVPKKWLVNRFPVEDSKRARGAVRVRIANARFPIRTKLDYELYEDFVDTVRNIVSDRKDFDEKYNVETGAPTIELKGIDAVRVLGLVALLDRAGRNRGAVTYMLKHLSEDEKARNMLMTLTAELGHTMLTTMMDVIKVAGVAWIRGRNKEMYEPEAFSNTDVLVSVPNLPSAKTAEPEPFPFFTIEIVKAKHLDSKKLAKDLSLAVGKVEEAYARAYRHLIEDIAKVWLQTTDLGEPIEPFTDKRGKLNTLGIAVAAAKAIKNHRPLDREGIKRAIAEATTDDIIKGLKLLYELYRIARLSPEEIKRIAERL